MFLPPTPGFFVPSQIGSVPVVPEVGLVVLGAVRFLWPGFGRPNPINFHKLGE